MQWRKASEVPPNTDEHPIRLKNLTLATGFYTAGDQVEGNFEEPMDYEDENGYLIEGWYRVYKHIDGMAYIVPAEVAEYLDETPTTPTGWPTKDEIKQALTDFMKPRFYDYTSNELHWTAAIDWYVNWLKSHTAPKAETALDIFTDNWCSKAEEPYRSAEEIISKRNWSFDIKRIVLEDIKTFGDQFKQSPSIKRPTEEALRDALVKHHVSMIEAGPAWHAGSELYNITEKALSLQSDK